MIRDHVVRFGSVRKRTLVVALMAPLVSLVIASPALAQEPTGDFAVFKQCPRFAPQKATFCAYTQIQGGEVTINKLTVPITNPTTFQGGIELNEATGAEKFIGALDGETLANTPQPVPGGLSALIDCKEIKGHWFPERVARKACKKFERSGEGHSEDFTEAYETVELVRPVSEIGINRANEDFQEGTALSLPVRVHLESPLLGSHCYIGSSSEPIVFNMTTATTNPPPPNKPIRGSVGEIKFKDEFQFVEIKGNHFLVDNTFSTPAATGCGGWLAFLIDPLIDSKIGLPSPSGYNTVIHAGPGYLATAEAVLASEH